MKNRSLNKNFKFQSSISFSDWRKINQVVRDAVGDAVKYEGRRLLNFCYRLHAENALLKGEIKGLREAVRIEKKQKKRKKGMFAEFRRKKGNAAIFFSPAKITAVLWKNL